MKHKLEDFQQNLSLSEDKAWLESESILDTCQS